MPTQQYPEHILKQADEMAKELAAEIYTIYENETDHEYTCLIEPERACAFCNGWGKAKKKSLEEIRDTLNLPALLMAKEQELESHKKIGQLQEWLYFVGICSNCGAEFHHHINEPFTTCQACGQGGEDTGKPPLIQQLRHELFQHQQVVKQLVEALEEAKDMVDMLLVIPGVTKPAQEGSPAFKIESALSTAKQLLEKKV